MLPVLHDEKGGQGASTPAVGLRSQPRRETKDKGNDVIPFARIRTFGLVKGHFVVDPRQRKIKRVKRKKKKEKKKNIIFHHFHSS